jgi:hypothetical protein
MVAIADSYTFSTFHLHFPSFFNSSSSFFTPALVIVPHSFPFSSSQLPLASSSSGSKWAMKRPLTAVTSSGSFGTPHKSDRLAEPSFKKGYRPILAHRKDPHPALYVAAKKKRKQEKKKK